MYGMKSITYSVDAQLDDYIFPSTLTRLTYNSRHQIVPEYLPHSLTKLVLGKLWCQSCELPIASLPNSITSITFESITQELKPGSLPDNLRSLKFTARYKFTTTITPNTLPRSLTKLKFATDFYLGQQFQLLFAPGSLPDTLQTLIVSESFNQHLEDGILPQSLRSLYLGSGFNQSLSGNVLPPALEKLSFGKSSTFNQELQPGDLPQSLRFLQFGPQFNHMLHPGVLPSMLETLSFIGFSRYNHIFVSGSLPDSLTIMINTFNLESFHRHSRHCPSQSLCSINLLMQDLYQRASHHYLLANNSINYSPQLVANVLPSALQELVFGASFDQDVFGPKVLPPNLKTLIMTQCKQPIIVGSLPSTLTHLNLGEAFNQSIEPKALPSSLTRLELGDMFNHPLLPGVLPSSLKWFRLGKQYDQIAESTVLPEGLTHLLVASLTQLKDVVLPSSLDDLEIENEVSADFQPPAIPASVKTLWMNAKLPAVNIQNLTNRQVSFVSTCAASLPNVTTHNLRIEYSVPRYVRRRITSEIDTRQLTVQLRMNDQYHGVCLVRKMPVNSNDTDALYLHTINFDNTEQATTSSKK
ncbi:hypothetical protein SAMD00019534_045680 [Acytostelium subglobosum LB1]|uniref:hypothetical protein n=1 Tax=Acytostelium subglobosum LB1 TaxID=1410327 RepID=UPI0006451B3A|nr:hypothetical protein SAMD00019534_045680 [Acytostelium subglobosum LB1]GAM21393.1 hypothetical protein SAMD00019534_045680 [Acytostelium subglobosum LB1]|eukprot:XP_012755512.1 hypothetical protein SAMD00019534_045680 [Acytostelium subglobosum LB1]